VTALLRVILLRDSPTPALADRLSAEHRRVVEEGSRLRAALPAYLDSRHTLLDAHCPLLPELQALVHAYEEPTTTDEFWATGLGINRWVFSTFATGSGAASLFR
jgi:hypothetical protein